MQMLDWIHMNAAHAPEKLALRFPGRDLSYRMLAELTDQYAAGLARIGVERGNCVAFLGLNSPEELALLFACARLGAMFLPLNWRLAAPEHQRILDDCPPAVLFVEPPFVSQTETIRPALGSTPLVSFGSAPKGWIDHTEFLLRGQGMTARTDFVNYRRLPVLVCYTSGSTGKPKGVLLSQDAIAWNALNSADLHAMTSDDRILNNLPLFHVGGLNNQLTPALCIGCMVVLQPKFDVDETFDAIERERISLAQMVPAQLTMMLASPRWATADFSSLRMITTGSTVVPERLISAVHERGVPLVQVYGSTETSPIAACLKPVDATRKSGSTGRAAAYCQVRVVDDRGQDTPPGINGEILVRGPNVMSGYWNAPGATASALVDGWFHTGDMGHFDAEGYLYVSGRGNEMIISGGENIYPAEIEHLLMESPDVAEALVIGAPDDRWGEIVVAVVVPRAGRMLTESDVMGQVRGRIAPFKQPKRVLFAEELPKTAIGKIRREDVRRMVAEVRGTDGAGRGSQSACNGTCQP